MAHRRTRFAQRSFTKRGTFWGRSPADTATTALAAATAVLDSTAVPVVEGETIVRIRGSIAVCSDQSIALEEFSGALGVLVASDQAVAVGVGSLPTPYTDQDSDLWMLHQYFQYRTEVDAAGNDIQHGFNIFPFDSKAMRKMETGQTLCFIVENGSATAGMIYYLNFATLFKVA